MHQATVSSISSQEDWARSVRLASAILCLVLVNGGALAGQPRSAVVVLPPQFISGGGRELLAAAAMACDRLARGLEKEPSLLVVDRSQLDRILREHALGQVPAEKIVIDKMIRTCRGAARNMGRPGGDTFRVRLLEVENAAKSAWLGRLGRYLVRR